jgi:multidrug efflux system outer membrane protein
MEKFAKITFCLTLAWLAGCTVGPDYKKPNVPVASAYGELPKAAPTNQPSQVVVGPESLSHWWMIFGDPDLNALIEQALRGNRDLRIALSRVRQARAQRGVVASGLLPEIDATGGYDHARGSQNVNIPLGALAGSSSGSSGAGKARRRDTSSAGGSSSAPGGPQNPFGLGGLPGVTTDLYQAGLDASWQIDIFGGTRRAIEAAKDNILASEENRRAVLISLLAEVATNYIGLRDNQYRLDLARKNLAAQRQTLAIFQARFQHGLSTELDLAQQTALVDSTAALIAPLESSERDSIHVLAFLIGGNAEALPAGLAAHRPLPSVPPQIPVGIPSDLMRQRPDIRGAERQLAAATAQIGSATADLFPKFSLTAMAGLDSSQPGDLFEWSSRYFGISPGVTWPILDWGRIRNNIKVQNELQEQALATYQNTIFRAFREVEDALVHYQKEQLRRAELDGAVTASRQSLLLATKSYDAGLVDLLTVLSSERSLLNAQDSLAQSDGAIRSNLVRLYVALGGGWEQ